MIKDSGFEIYYKDGFACLTIYPPEDSGRRLYPEDVAGKLKILGISGFKKSRISEIIEDASGRPVPLVKWSEGRKLSPVIKVIVDEDAMTARVIITPEKLGGEPLSADMIKKALSEKNIIFGVDEQIINSVVLKCVYNQEIKTAFGRPAVDQMPATPEYFFIVDRGKPFRELEYQRIDLKELNFIQNKKKGALLAKLQEPQPPVDGKDVFGRIITAKRSTETVRFEAGTGADLSEDKTRITAAIDGNARLENGKVIVEPLVTVENIDYSNGNMDFTGSIDIKGRVSDGFYVKAAGLIQIEKSISRVNINSGSDLILKAGISGNDEGIIECGGDLYAKYIESANVICKGNIYVEEAIMHSTVKAGGNIILSGKRAEIFGGKIFSTGGIKCKKIGSLNEPLTEFFIGLTLDEFSAMDNLHKKISEESAAIDEIELQIKQLNNALKNPGKPDNSVSSVEKLKTALQQLSVKAEVFNKKLSAHLHELHELKKGISLNENAEVDAEQQIYGNVHIYFNHLRWDSANKGTGKTRIFVKQGKLLEK